MCCGSAQWKREAVPDHKFDFVDIREFHSTSCGNRLGYGWLYTLVIKDTAVYIADIYTAVALLASGRWAASYLQSSTDSDSDVLVVPFSIGKWIFTGCIIFSFLLLAWEARKARAIIKSRDISYAFTNVMSQNFYSLRDYDYYCFFSQINNSKKKKDEFAFFVFFTFKGWKQLLLADAPRQVINAITLYSFAKSEQWTTDLSVYFSGSIFKSAVIVTMLFTLVIWVGSALLLLVAAVMYVPLLCYIQGNLKEYCCHKVDKRIAELMKRKTRKRLAREAEIQRAEARGDFSHLKDPRTGKYRQAPLPQPTLPKVNVDGDETFSDAGSTRYPPPSQRNNANAFAQSGYPYVTSDPDMASHRQYAESFTSADGLANRGMPMGFDSSVSLAHNYSRPDLSVSQDMQRAPTYRSQQDDPYGGYGYDDEKDYYATTATDDRFGQPLTRNETLNYPQFNNDRRYQPSHRQQFQHQQQRQQQQQPEPYYDDHSAIDFVDSYTAEPYHAQGRQGTSWEDSYSRPSAPASRSKSSEKPRVKMSAREQYAAGGVDSYWAKAAAKMGKWS